jgi:hypothetical protein
MSFCTARGNELRESLQNQPAPDMPDRDRRLLREAVDAWDAERRSVLGALCVLLQPGGGEAAALWRGGVDRLREHLRRFSDTLQSVTSPLEGSLQFIQSSATADDAFVSAVGAAVVAAEARDEMVRYLDLVRQETASLEVKWNAVTAQHASYQQQELAVIDQVDALVRDAIRAARDLDAKVASLIADSLSTAREVLQAMPEGGADTLSIPNNNELVAAGMAVDTFRALAAGIEDQRARFERYMREELGSVLFLFSDFRQDTQRFIEAFGYQTVLKQEEAANRALEGIVSNGGTSPGNRKDAEQFVEAARTLVRGHVNDARNTWDAFVEKHDRKFFGPVGPDIARALLDRDLFEAKYRNLQAENLNALAATWRGRAREVWGVDFSGIPPHAADSYRNALEDRLRDLDALLRDPLLQRFGDGMRTVIDSAWSFITR